MSRNVLRSSIVIEDNCSAGAVVLGRTIQNSLLICASDAPFSAPRHFIKNSTQVFHRFIHRFLQPIVCVSGVKSQKPQDVAFAQMPFYCFYNLIDKNIAVVVWGVENVDILHKGKHYNNIGGNTTVDNFVDKVDNLWTKTVKMAVILFLVLTCVLVWLSVMVKKVYAAEDLVDMQKIAWIESNNNPLAWNKKEDARGTYQIRSVVLSEWNQYHPKDRHEPEELFFEAVNEKIARWYLNVRIPQMIRYFKKSVNERSIIIAYNAGVRYVMTGQAIPKTTERYLKKYLAKP